MNLYDFIPEDRYISREELVSATGWSDRRVRNGINELRKNPDTIVVSNSQGKGYKRPMSIEEIQAYLNESISRCNDEHAKQKAAIQAIRNRQKKVEKSGQFLFDFS